MMDLQRKPNGKWKLRWNEGGRKRARTFDARAMRSSSRPSDPPQAARAGRDPRRPSPARVRRDLLAAARPAEPQPGDAAICTAASGRSTSCRASATTASASSRRSGSLDSALSSSARGVGTATVVKAMTIVQSILSFAVSEELVEYNAAAAVTQAAVHARTRAAHLPATRGRADPREAGTTETARSFRCSPTPGPRPEEVVCRLAWDDVGEQHHPLRRHQAPRRRSIHASAGAAGRGPEGVVPRLRTADREAAGVPRPRRRVLGPGRLAQLAPANMARRAGTPAQRPQATDAAAAGCAPAGTRPRDLRSSYVTLRVYEGVPLTQIGRGGRNERADDRAALRRRGRGLGRQARPGGGPDPGGASRWWTRSGPSAARRRS